LTRGTLKVRWQKLSGSPQLEYWSDGVMVNFSRMKQDNCTGVLSIKPQNDIVEHDALKRVILPYSMFIIHHYAVLKTLNSVG